MWTEPVEMVADHGPLDGVWLVSECNTCGVVGLESKSGAGMSMVLSALEQLGCNPRRVR